MSEHDSTGSERIAAERKRQIDKEGWTPRHDDALTYGALTLAAVCYATPVKLYWRKDFGRGISFVDPWPWRDEGDKRLSYGTCRDNPGNVVPDPKTYTPAERIDLLVKSGALIAAEIDRLLRVDKTARTGADDDD